MVGGVARVWCSGVRRGVIVTYAEAVASATHSFDEREAAYDGLVALLVAEHPALRRLSAREAAQRANALRLMVHVDCVRAGLYA